MPNLFPKGNLESITLKDKKPTQFKGSYAFNFETGEFIKNSDGSIAKVNDFEAYVQWCQKAMMTARFKYIAYSNRYGEESRNIIGSNLDNNAIELELKRITKESLMVHPRTKDVDNFQFRWGNGEVYYDYEVITTLDEKKLLSRTLKVR